MDFTAWRCRQYLFPAVVLDGLLADRPMSGRTRVQAAAVCPGEQRALPPYTPTFRQGDFPIECYTASWRFPPRSPYISTVGEPIAATLGAGETSDLCPGVGSGARLGWGWGLERVHARRCSRGVRGAPSLRCEPHGIGPSSRPSIMPVPQFEKHNPYTGALDVGSVTNPADQPRLR